MLLRHASQRSTTAAGNFLICKYHANATIAGTSDYNYYDYYDYYYDYYYYHCSHC